MNEIIIKHEILEQEAESFGVRLYTELVEAEQYKDIVFGNVDLHFRQIDKKVRIKHKIDDYTIDIDDFDLESTPLVATFNVDDKIKINLEVPWMTMADLKILKIRTKTNNLNNC